MKPQAAAVPSTTLAVNTAGSSAELAGPCHVDPGWFPAQIQLPPALVFPDTSIELRNYQQAAIHAVIKAWKQGITGSMVCLPPGTGKTIVFCALTRYLAEEMGRISGGASLRVLVLAHREELLKQTHDKLKRVWPGVVASTVNASCKDVTGQVRCSCIEYKHRNTAGNQVSCIVYLVCLASD
jgi:superfamily II DNA or RNA helicase